MDAEPPFFHDRAARIGVLLVNLGTPDAPTTAAVRRYLAQFLSDPRVVEIPPVVWKPILHGVILNVRSARSARRYATIWTKDGSPLLVHSLRQKTLLTGYLGQRLKELGLPSDHAQVELGMRYGEPSIDGALDKLEARRLRSRARAAAVSAVRGEHDGVRLRRRVRRRSRTCAAFRRCASSTPITMIPATSRRSRRASTTTGSSNGRPNKLVLSFHGVPRRTLDLGDPYHCHCQKTGRLLAQELGLTRRAVCDLVPVALRPRANGSTPYTAADVAGAGEGGHAPRRRLPARASSAIAWKRWKKSAVEAQGSPFSHAGGKEFHVIPCLNEHPAWIAALADLALRNLRAGSKRRPMRKPRAHSARARTLGAGELEPRARCTRRDAAASPWIPLKRVHGPILPVRSRLANTPQRPCPPFSVRRTVDDRSIPDQ